MQIEWYKILDCIFFAIELKDNVYNFLERKLFYYEILIVCNGNYGLQESKNHTHTLQQQLYLNDS